MVDYRYTTAFLTVARLGSISKAADALNISQSAISRQISLFEESLGENVFLRGSRGIQLTARGQSLFKKLSGTDEWISTEFFNEPSPIRIGGLEAILNIWLGEKLVNTAALDLPSKLYLKQMGNETIEKALAAGEIDIGLSSRKIESEWINSTKLYTEKISIISKGPVDMGHLEKYCWIGVAKTEYLKRLAKDKEPTRTIQAGSLDLLFKLVKAGHGIAAVAENLVPDKGLKSYPTKLASEVIYLNLATYQQTPSYLNKFVKQFFI